jgi:putative transposase
VGIADQLEVDIEALEIMPDHVHLFVAADPTKAPQYLANQFKGYTSRVLRREFAHLRTRAAVLWSRSYDVGSVGHVSEETVRKYIETQEQRS